MPGSVATPSGFLPTGTVAVTVCVEPSITDTVLSPLLVTYTVRVPVSSATPTGFLLTGTTTEV